MGQLFGTDGVRGIVDKDLTSDLAVKIGTSVSRVLKKNLNKDKLKFIIGSDTRESKDMFTNAISYGVTEEGCDMINVGVLPTPAIAYLVKLYGLDGAFVVSASHNPSEYNGIKVLDKDGFKLSDELEEECEDIILGDFKLDESIKEKGSFINDPTAIEHYIRYLKSTVGEKLKGIKILIDTANGASYETADRIFSELGCDYTIINNNPDGKNINDNAGSTHIEGLQEKVVEGNYDVGIAYDGDADRCILVDEKGNVIDGDFIIAIIGNELKKEGKLTNNTVVGTIMSNMGLKKFCEEANINFVDTKVGDKYVLREMLKENYIIGGEQSGHIIFKELANTGDGELTSLQILNVMAKENKKLSELASIMKKYPQKMINVDVTKEGKKAFETREDIKEVIKSYEDKIGNRGRVNVRPSGTENLIRVMFEGESKEEIERLCSELATYISKELGNNKTYTLKDKNNN